MKTVLVTGGAGFLGSHLCENLLTRGHRVICLDNFYTGSPQNIAHLSNHPRFRFIEHDIVSPLPITDTVHEIYNLACPASPPKYQRDPHLTIRINTTGIFNVLAVARRTKARLLQASTSEVYGDPLRSVQKETDWGNVNCTGPRACYDEGKRCAETILFDEWRKTRHRIKVARIFNTYGPRMQENDGRIVSNFIVQALSGRPITVYGDGSQTRSFCYVDDLIAGLIKLMESPDDVTGPVNLGNPEQLSALSLAKRIAKLLRTEVSIVFHPLPVDDPKRRRPDISQAKTLLGWKPETPLNEGLQRTIAYFRPRIVEQPRPVAARSQGAKAVQDVSAGALSASV
jgi:UDP-glucuronate decarboxylase